MNVHEQILEILAKYHEPLDAVFLTEKIGANKTSIYRQLQTMEKSGELIGLDFGDGKKHYELSTLSHHHHLVCIKCKAVNDVDLQEEKFALKNSSFKVLRHSLEFFGLCAKCSRI